MRLFIRTGPAFLLALVTLLTPGPFGRCARAAGPSAPTMRVIPAATAGRQDQPRIEVLSSDAGGVSLRFTLPSLAVEDFQLPQGRFQSLTIPDGGLEGAAGEPGIPDFTRLVSIPDEAGVTVTTTVEETQELQGVRLMPVQGVDGGSFAFDPAAYARGGYSSDISAAAGAPALCRELRLVPLRFHPVQYDPARGTVRVASTMKVDIRFTGHDLTNSPGGHARSIAPSFDRLYRHLVVNYDGPSDGQRVERGPGSSSAPTTPAVTTRLQPLVDWRSARAQVHLATTAETGTTKELDQGLHPERLQHLDPTPGVRRPGRRRQRHLRHPHLVREPLRLRRRGGPPLHPARRRRHPGRRPPRPALLRHPHRAGGHRDQDRRTTRARPTSSATPAGSPAPAWWATRALPATAPSRCSSGSRRACARSATPRSTPSSPAPSSSQMTTALNRGDTIFCYRGYYGMSGWSNSNTNALTNGASCHFAVISTCGTGSFASGTSNSEAFLRAGTADHPQGRHRRDRHGHHRHPHALQQLLSPSGSSRGSSTRTMWEMGAAHTRGQVRALRRTTTRAATRTTRRSSPTGTT